MTRGSILVLFLSGVPLFQNCTRVEFAGETTLSSSQSNELNPPSCVDLTIEDVQPKVKWDWVQRLDRTNDRNFPQSIQVMSTPMVADLNGDQRPEVVFTTFTDSSYNGIGVLRIVDGATGETIRSIGDADLAPFGTVSPLLIDLDADGKVEIIYPHYLGFKVIALNYDGSRRWIYNTGNEKVSNYASFSAVDIDADGKSEIIAGKFIIGENAERLPVSKVQLASSVAPGHGFGTSLNVDRPNDLQLVNSNGVFDRTGSLIYSLPPAIYAAANINGLPGMELVGVASGTLKIVDAKTGSITVEKDLNEDNDIACLGSNGTRIIGGGPPTLADFDGNPSTVEIAMATGRYLTIMDSTGKRIAQYETQDCSSKVTGVSAFDFNGDGKPEILYGDEEYFRVFEMHQGELRVVASLVNPSGTLLEYPVVADIDGNRSSEVLVASNNYAAGTFYRDPGEEADRETARQVTGVRALESSKKDMWMQTRSLWNQFHYNPSLVTDRLTAVSRGPASDHPDSRLFRRNRQDSIWVSKCSKAAAD